MHRLTNFISTSWEGYETRLLNQNWFDFFIRFQLITDAETKTGLIDALDALALYNQLEAHMKQFADQLSSLFLKPLFAFGKKTSQSADKPLFTCNHDQANSKRFTRDLKSNQTRNETALKSNRERVHMDAKYSVMRRQKF